MDAVAARWCMYNAVAVMHIKYGRGWNMLEMRCTFAPVCKHVAEAVDFAGVVGMHIPPLTIVVPSDPLPAVISYTGRRID